MKAFISDFKAFISKGNVIDLAVAVVIGGSFNKIVTSLVNDLLMPLLSVLLGGNDFSNLSLTLREASSTSDELLLNYGLFLQNIVNFLIIALSIFVVIKAFSKFKRKEEVVIEEKAPSVTELSVLQDIKDLLEKR